MLTVFKANEDAVRFYERLQYEIDETSPSRCGVSTSSYEIMSKPLGQLHYEIDETRPSQCGVSTSSYEIMSKPLGQPAGGKRLLRMSKAAAAKERDAGVAQPA